MQIIQKENYWPEARHFLEKGTELPFQVLLRGGSDISR